MSNKKPAKKSKKDTVFRGKIWTVVRGKLVARPGRPGTTNLFRLIAEKLPFDSLPLVCKDVKSRNLSAQGVYLAHDSMGNVCYVGRGNIFKRLGAHFKAHPLELVYYSFYVVAEKCHEREIETLLIRATGPQLQYNDRKKPITIQSGNIKDYEPHTEFYERQRKQGRRARGS